MLHGIIAIITARGGSKGLPQKNILSLAGKPLIAHTIQAALGSHIFSKVLVSTDDTAIKKVALEYGAEIINRPDVLATDTASSLDVITHALKVLGDDHGNTHFVLLQPTSPLRTKSHIIEAWKKYQSIKAMSLVSVTKEKHSPHKLLIEEEGVIKPVFKLDFLTTPRQNLPQTYRPNGAIYIAKIKAYRQSQNLFQEPLSIYIMTEKDSIDIDTKEDLNLCETILKSYD